MSRRYNLAELLGTQTEGRILNDLFYNVNHWPRLAADDVPCVQDNSFWMSTSKAYRYQPPFVQHFYHKCLPNDLLARIREETGDPIALWNPERDCTGFSNGFYGGFLLKPGLRWADDCDDWRFNRGSRGEDRKRKIFVPQIVCVMEPKEVYLSLRERVTTKWKDGVRTIRQFKKDKYEAPCWQEKMRSRENSRLRIIPIEIVIRSTVTNFEVGKLELRPKSRWHEQYFGKQQGLLQEKLDATDRLCRELCDAAKRLGL